FSNNGLPIPDRCHHLIIMLEHSGYLLQHGSVVVGEENPNLGHTYSLADDGNEPPTRSHYGGAKHIEISLGGAYVIGWVATTVKSYGDSRFSGRKAVMPFWSAGRRSALCPPPGFLSTDGTRYAIRHPQIADAHAC